MSGCISMPSYVPASSYTDISIPELNTSTTAYLGESMLRQAKGFYGDSITLGSADGVQTQIFGGKFCRVSKESQKYISSDPKSIGVKNGYGQVVSFSNFLIFKPEDKKVCPNGNYLSCYDQSEVSMVFKENDICTAENSFQRVIEYNGKSGDVLNFTYREFSGGMARQAFTTDFKIDLSEGNIAGYKGSRIEIVEATNNHIKYVVLKNFNTL